MDKAGTLGDKKQKSSSVSSLCRNISQSPGNIFKWLADVLIYFSEVFSLILEQFFLFFPADPEVACLIYSWLAHELCILYNNIH